MKYFVQETQPRLITIAPGEECEGNAFGCVCQHGNYTDAVDDGCYILHGRVEDRLSDSLEAGTSL